MTSVVESSVLLDIERIKQLKARYCYAVDQRDPQAVTELFIENACADFGPMGVLHNQSEIAQFFVGIFSMASLTVHMLHNPVIDVHGDTATGKWYAEIPTTLGPTAAWQAGRYDDEYVRVNGEWKISKQVYTFIYLTPYDEGWAKTRIMNLAP